MKEIPTVEKIKNDSNRWRRLNWAIPFIIGITVFLVVGFISIGFYIGKHLYKFIHLNHRKRILVWDYIYAEHWLTK